MDKLVELWELLANATPVRDGWHMRLKGTGEERYDLLGDPCGFPIATFGDHNDAALDLGCRRLVPALLDRLQSQESLIQELVGALEPFAATIIFDANKKRGDRHWATFGKPTSIDDVLRANTALESARKAHAEGGGES